MKNNDVDALKRDQHAVMLRIFFDGTETLQKDSACFFDARVCWCYLQCSQ